MSSPIATITPRVCYVDPEQAVIETHLTTRKQITGTADTPRYPTATVDVFIDIEGPFGYHDEVYRRCELTPTQRRAVVRLDIVQPERWFPATLGGQPLYTLNVLMVAKRRDAEGLGSRAGGVEDDGGDGVGGSVAEGAEVIEQQSFTLGLTSIRRASDTGAGRPMWIVNSEACELKAVVTVDLSDANKFLPATGDSLMVVRDHYGPDQLFDANDRAGILTVQCVPLDAQGRPEWSVKEHVTRLSSHPSLAGWYVGHLGELGKRLARRIRRYDPLHPVFHDLTPAA